MLDIQFKSARTLPELLDHLEATPGKTYLVAGGTDLMVQARAGILPRATWIDVTRIKELRGIEEMDDHVWIGGSTPYVDLERSSIVRAFCPVLHQAVLEVGSPQIRALGTLAGNFANASPAGDGIPPLMAMDASVVLRSKSGERAVPAARFFLGPRQTVRSPGEVITAFKIPKWPGHQGIFLKLGPRKSLAIAKVSLALCVSLEEQKIARVQVALGAVAPTVVRAPKTEALLAAKTPTSHLYEEARALVMTEVAPITDHRSTAEYRRSMCGVLLVKALRELAGDSTESRLWDVELR